MARPVPYADVVDRTFQRAIAAEIRAEIGRQGLRRTAVGNEAGIDPKAWTNYFVEPIKRDVHLKTVSAVCRVLGIPLSELVARAEALEPNLPPEETEGDVVELVRREAPPAPPLDAAARRVKRTPKAKAAREQQDRDAEG